MLPGGKWIDVRIGAPRGPAPPPGAMGRSTRGLPPPGLGDRAIGDDMGTGKGAGAGACTDDGTGTGDGTGDGAAWACGDMAVGGTP